jgi:glycine/D-amino acid oxidase-like deaminating enzyme
MSEDVEYLADTGWVDRPEAAEPALEGNVACDVAVVGGGLAGMAAALRLAERGADVVLLEADLCGWGASSRAAGYLTNTLSADPDVLATFYRRRIGDLVRFADSAVHFTEALLARLSIECEFERTGIVGAAVSRGQLRRGRRMARFLGAAGWDSEFVTGRELGLPDAFLGGVRERIGGLLNPGMYALGVRQALLASDARVFEHTAVRTVEDDGTRVTVGVPAGRVRAERILLATNAYSRDLAIAPRRLAKPLWVSQVETEPIAPERVDEIGWTSRAGIATLHQVLENYRLTARNTIVIGTRQLQPARGSMRGRRPDPPVVADLVRGFRERFPSLRDVAPRRAWGGWIAMTPSWLPVAGEVGPRVLYGIGCNGHGLAQAPYLGDLLADRLAGDDVDEDLRGVWRKRPRFAPGVLSSAPALRAAWRIDRIADRANRRRGYVKDGDE